MMGRGGEMRLIGQQRSERGSLLVVECLCGRVQAHPPTPRRVVCADPECRKPADLRVVLERFLLEHGVADVERTRSQ